MPNSAALELQTLLRATGGSRQAADEVEAYLASVSRPTGHPVEVLQFGARHYAGTPRNREQSNAMTRLVAARLAIAFAITFAVILAVLHFLEPEFNSDGHLISEYELGRYGWLMRLAFFSMAGASLALCFAIHEDLETTAGHIGKWWLLLVAVAYVGAGLFVPDESTGLGLPADPAQLDRGAIAPTLNATLHGLSGVVVIASSPIVFTLLSRSLTWSPRWTAKAHALRWPTCLAWVGLASLPISLALYNAMQQPGTLDLRVIVSVTNRFMILTYAAWLAACAYQIANEWRPLPCS